MNFKQAIDAVKECLNEAIKDTGLSVQSISFHDHWKSSLTLSVPKELENLAFKLNQSLEKEGIMLRSFSFSWHVNGGWNREPNSIISINVESFADRVLK